MQLVHLAELLESEETTMLAELRNIRSVVDIRADFHPALQQMLEDREKQLLRELDRLHRVFAATKIGASVVTFVYGGAA